ncbi:RarD [Defluviimonas sp. 20V17]|uniref:Chloramphenicol-sensitive protein RarD n=1 Tax=Allgaiera indica TaxID=765699 RepID=A0AAN4UQ14_9RHOB|nr:EamA family transporter RarD [Allgaiera indica]KDB03436.1 RarD [Defluviimonas sp. 20V17]GHE00367.1 permease [Allgaiera indica]SDW62995.1 chloramphenicol-sensitive protein RarD [Allgaiera indica]
MSEAGKGVLAMIAACTFWGASALYYRLLDGLPAIEVLAHRTLWSALFFGVVLAFQGRLGQVARLLRGRRAAITLTAALMISANWFLFIFSVQINHVMQASLGYYIFPLVAVLIGVVVFRERIGMAQALAVALAGAAVLVLALGLGVTPWISLALAGSFGCYGLIKKWLDAGPVVSVTAEVLMLSPLALAYLAGLGAGLWPGGPAPVFGADARTALLLAFSGVLTGGPLILFSYAARRVNMATMGLLQYINPTLQFVVATLVFAEPFTRWHLIAFALIWTALAIYSAAALRQDRAARRAAASAGMSGISVT